MKTTQLPDLDYTLTEGAAWLQTGPFSVRVQLHPDDGLLVSVYRDGHETDPEIVSAFAPNPNPTQPNDPADPA
jgi:hypothetical protein